jgi:hypothetical protein
VYAAYPDVAAMFLSGSTARGHADKYSDIEVGVFWHTPPTDVARQAAVARSGGDLLRSYPHNPMYNVWSDDLMIGRSAPALPQSGVLVEVGHYTTAHIERTLGLVLDHHDPDETKHNLLAGIMDAIPLHGADMIRLWQARAAVYPRALTVATIKRHGVIDHFWRWEMFLHRGENLMQMYAMFSQVAHKLLHMLLALNRVYYFGFKWLDQVVARLTIAPTNLLFRLQQVYTVPPAEGAHVLAMLVEDTFSLVEQHLPEIDVNWFRAVFRYRRPAWERMPPVS